MQTEQAMFRHKTSKKITAKSDTEGKQAGTLNRKVTAGQDLNAQVLRTGETT